MGQLVDSCMQQRHVSKNGLSETLHRSVSLTYVGGTQQTKSQYVLPRLESVIKLHSEVWWNNGKYPA
jgi:hypothetical protein